MKKRMKKRYVAVFVFVLLAIAAVIAFGSSPDTSTPRLPTGAAAVAFTVLDHGSFAQGMTERKNYQIQSPEELAYFWEQIYGADAPPLPDIDFRTEDVLAVFSGEKPSGGYSIAIASVTDKGALERGVTIRHMEPGASCVTTQAITSPYELVVVPRTDAPIKREDVTIVEECE